MSLFFQEIELLTRIMESDVNYTIEVDNGNLQLRKMSYNELMSKSLDISYKWEVSWKCDESFYDDNLICELCRRFKSAVDAVELFCDKRRNLGLS